METNMQELFGPWAGSVCSPVCSHPSCWAAKKKARLGQLPESEKNECWLERLECSNILEHAAAPTARSGLVQKACPDNHHTGIRNTKTINDVLSQTGPWCYARFFLSKETKSAAARIGSTEHKVHIHYLNEQIKLPHDKHSKVNKGHKRAKSSVAGKEKRFLS